MNPGSKQAIEAGCTCPVMDNANGEGIYLNELLCFWYNAECPVHKNQNLLCCKNGAN